MSIAVTGMTSNSLPGRHQGGAPIAWPEVFGNDRPVVGNFVELVHEHRAEPAQALDHESVMDDLMTHVDRRTEPLEGKLDDLNRAIDAGAETARGGDQHLERRLVQHSDRHLRLRLQP